jgi:release factor glutamine methyltransferase
VTPERPDPAGDAIVARLRAAGCVFAEDEAALLLAAGRSGADLDDLVAERVSGRPLEYVLGWAEFAGLRIPVTDGVFVPRRRSELLARLAADRARTTGRTGRVPVVVDLCCGAGALGAAVAAAVPGVELHATDIDPAAVECARRAIAPFAGRVYAGDLYHALPGDLRGRVDVLVVNAPYVPTGEIAFMPAEARNFEHPTALDGGPDGLEVLGRAVAGAAAWLAPAGTVLAECAEHQSTALAGLLTAAGLTASVHRDDDLDATAVTGRRP